MLKEEVKHKIHTTLTQPHLVFLKYGTMLKAKLNGDIVPLEGEDYDRHWKWTSFTGKTVLDLGADYGSTAFFFLKQGACRVIAVEGSKTRTAKLKTYYGGSDKVVCVEKFIGSARDIEELIGKYKVDIVKVDIQGAERYLMQVSPKLLLSVNEWLIETHSDEIRKNLERFFVGLGFRVYLVLHTRYYSANADCIYVKK